MNNRFLVGSFVALTIGAVLLVNCKTTTAPSSARVPSAASEAPPAVPTSTPPAQGIAAVTRTVQSPLAVASDPGRDGANRLVERRNLSTPTTTPALETMKQFERDEMVLLAQIQKRVGRAAPPAVKELIDRRRAGASFVELWAIADEELSNDPEMLLAVRGWLNEVVRPAEPAKGTSPTVPAATTQPLDLGGSVAPVRK